MFVQLLTSVPFRGPCGRELCILNTLQKNKNTYIYSKSNTHIEKNKILKLPSLKLLNFLFIFGFSDYGL